MKLMMMKPMNLKLAAFVAATAVCAAVQAGPRPPVVDSTGFRAGVAGAALPIPAPGLTANDVKLITTAIVSNTTNTNFPPGYSEVSVPMGPRDLGNGGGTYGTSYYANLGYPFYSGANNCAGNPNPPRVIATTTGPGVCGDAPCQGGSTTSYFVCEPQGTRTTLQKVIGASILQVTRTMLDSKTLPPAVGMSTQATTAYCQVQGYMNYVPGTVVSSPGPGGGCDNGTVVTRWNGSAFYNDKSCYNNVLQSLQCWK